MLHLRITFIFLSEGNIKLIEIKNFYQQYVFEVSNDWEEC